MRRFILSALALFTIAASANATCDDTLYLQSITVYRQTVRNDTVLGTWDSTVVNPWNLSDLKNAGPLGYSVAYRATDTALHYLRFSSNCGSDSTSNVTIARVRDTLTTVQLKKVHQVSVDTFNTRMTVNRMGDGDGHVNYANAVLDYLWESGSAFQIGVQHGTATIEAWSGTGMGYIFSSAGTSMRGISQPIGALRQSPVNNAVSFLSSLKSDVDLVGKGKDSVRTELLMYRYVYDFTSPLTSILPHAVAFRSMSAHSVGTRVEIRLGAPAAVQILSPNGQVARVLPAAAEQNWDGKDAFGRKLTGIWIVRAEGIGAVPVMVR